MNSLDLIVIAIVVLSGLFAFVRGFVREALSILAWVGAGVLAYYGYPRFLPAVSAMIANPLLAQVVTAGVLFVVCLLVFSIIVGMVSARVRASGMGSVDRSLGLLFGLARGCLVICLAYMVVIRLLEPGVWPPKADGLPPWIAEARLRPYLDEGATPLAQMVPQQLLDKGAATANQAAQTIQNAGEEGAIDMLHQQQQKQKDPQPAPGYDPASRDDMNRAVEQSTGK